MNRLPSIFITGTDTGVGKTVITALLGHIYSMAGVKVGLEKPVMTGIDGNRRFEYGSDLLFLRQAVKTDLSPVNSYCFPEPVSPHLAAALKGSPIDIEKIEADHRELMAKSEAVLVEGAGGLLVPLKEGFFMADLVSRLRLPVIVVSRPCLGTVNHTLLTLECARTRQISVIGVVMNRYPAVPSLSESDNPWAIERFGKVPLLAVVPDINGLSVEAGTPGALQETAENIEANFNIMARLSSWRVHNG